MTQYDSALTFVGENRVKDRRQAKTGRPMAAQENQLELDHKQQSEAREKVLKEQALAQHKISHTNTLWFITLNSMSCIIRIYPSLNYLDPMGFTLRIFGPFDIALPQIKQNYCNKGISISFNHSDSSGRMDNHIYEITTSIGLLHVYQMVTTSIRLLHL